jgi:ATP-binding cassette subfamily B protein
MRRVAKIRQNDASDCGPASLASVAAYHGLEYSVASLRYMSGTGRKGTTIKGLIDAASSIGLQAVGFKAATESLQKIPLPAILHIKKENGFLHYVVLESVRNSGYKVMDPSTGTCGKWSRSRMDKLWSGILILFNPCREKKKRSARLREPESFLIKKAVSKHWKIFPSLLLVSLLNIAATLAVALFIKELLDVVIPGKEKVTLQYLSLLMAAVMIIATLLSFTRSSLALKLSVGSDILLNREYITNLLHAPLPFLRSYKTGELSSRLSDIQRIKSVVSGTLPGMATATITLLLSMGLMFCMNTTLAWVCTIFVPLFPALFLLHDKYNKPLTESLMEDAATYQSNIIDNIKAAESIRNYSMAPAAFSKSMKSLSALMARFRQTGKAAIVAGTSAEALTWALTITILWTGSYLVITGRATAGELISFYAVTSMFSSPLAELASSVPSLREGFTASSRIYDITSFSKYLERMQVRNPFVIRQKHSSAAISVNGISFAYPGEPSLFEKLSFDAEYGKITHIEGRNGSGKSTLVSILAGHLLPQKGSVIYNNPQINSPEEILPAVSIVTQEPALYGETVADCILGGNGNLKEKKSLEKLATVADKLDLGKLLTTSLRSSDYTTVLSRGEQQRIAYARALAKGSKIMILDEVTSSLDTWSEELIIRSLLDLRSRGCAVIVISHNGRVSKIADNTITIDKEREIKNMGAHPG